MKVLFLFWHGLGDNILATPAIKAYKKANPDHYIGWALQARFNSAQLWNPYIWTYHHIGDAWAHPKGYNEGCKSCIAEGKAIKKYYKYDKIIVIDHKSSSKHKIHRTADEMGVTVTDPKTEFYFQYPVQELIIPTTIFFHGKTGVENKDLDISHVPNYFDHPMIYANANIDKPCWYWAEYLKYAPKIYVVDSVYFHIACALGRKPTLSYFARGKSTFDIVKPLHMDVSDTVIYEL